jgi:hypothetical protein
VIPGQIHLDEVVGAKLALEKAARGDQQPVPTQPDGYVTVGSRDETRLPETPAAAYDLAGDLTPDHGLAQCSRW